MILRGRVPEGEPVPAPVDLTKVKAEMAEKGLPTRPEDVSAYTIYPDVFSQYADRYEKYGDLSVLDTPTFFFGMTRGEEIRATIEKGNRVVQFELNGMPREVVVHDDNLEKAMTGGRKAEKSNPGEVGATLSGSVVKVLVNLGAAVKKGDPLVVTEAMKMETSITAPISGTVGYILVKAGSRIESGDLLIVIE